MTPRARRAGLVVQEIDGELLVYDRDRHRAHCLGAVAAAIWKRCDGTRTIERIASAVAAELGRSVDETAVRVALARLGRARLLEGPAHARAPGRTRRDWLRTAALTGLSVVSITAPLAAQAASCIPDAQCVNLPNSLCPGRPCCSSPGLSCLKQGGGPQCTCR